MRLFSSLPGSAILLPGTTGAAAIVNDDRAAVKEEPEVIAYVKKKGWSLYTDWTMAR